MTLFKAGVRSLFLESAWNNEGQQNIGRTAVMQPVIEELYQDPTTKKARFLELLMPFNTNPITSGLVLGASIKVEELRAKGDTKITNQDELLSSISSVASAQGDQIFWNTWLPFCCLAAFSLYFLSGSYLAPFLLPVLFSLLAFPTRFATMSLGYKSSLDVCNLKLMSMALSFRRGFHTATIFLAGFITALVLAQVPGELSLSKLRIGVLSLIIFIILLISTWLRKRWPQLVAFLYLINILCFYLVFMLIL
ncbi:MAG: PTS system mannose/fructose/sorbose family transporter subunit IID [Deltaproteobacteria bacterium]|nr:PTS system mannose/fructose/sorbose family transporter subunit IID [Deltaproteobacteria bacterium]